MRNLDIVDTRDKLLTYAKVGLLSSESRMGLPLLSQTSGDDPNTPDGRSGKKQGGSIDDRSSVRRAA